MFTVFSGSYCLHCLVNLLFPLDSSNIESILETLALEGASRPKASAVATISQSEADGDHACHNATLQGPFLFPDPLAGAEVGLSQGRMSAGCHVPHIAGVLFTLGMFFLKGFPQATHFPVAQAMRVVCKNVPTSLVCLQT